MRVFVTGATGFIGSRVVRELLGAGHEVLGLARSGEAADALKAAGAEAHTGTLEDPASLARGASEADAVIHTAFDHDFSRFAENCQKDYRVITAMADALVGTKRPIVITSSTGIGNAKPGEPALEKVIDWSHALPRIAGEKAAAEALEKGVSVITVRLPQVHDHVRQGIVSFLIEVSKAKKLAAYVGEGQNRWPAVHVDDAARLYRLALERNEPGARYHGVAEEGVSLRRIAETIGTELGVPVASVTSEEAPQQFGWFAPFMQMDMIASSEWTRADLNWTPAGPDLVTDLQHMDYSKVAPATPERG